MKSQLFLFSLLFTIVNVTGQTFEWAKSIGGSASDQGNSIDVDASGNVYTIGHFQDTVDFNPDTGTFNLSSTVIDIFICKLDSNGNFLWAKNMGGPGSVGKGHSVAVDDSGYVYITGTFSGTIDFDPGLGTFNLITQGWNYDIFICKLDSNGNFLWAKNMGGTDNAVGKSIAVDTLDNVYITGSFKDTIDFNPGLGTDIHISAGNSDIFVCKLNASGNFIWAISIGGAYWDEGTSVTVDKLGSIYTTGYFWGTIDFDPGFGTYNLSSAGREDIFISKIDNSGNLIWAKNMGGKYGDRSSSIDIDNQGNIYTSGYFQDTADFDPNSGTFNLRSTGLDIFVSKLNSSGNFIWAKEIGKTMPMDKSYSIAVDNTGNVYTTGYFQDTADFDPGVGTFNLTSIGQDDIFISKLDSTGNFAWARSMGGTSIDRGNSITVDATGNVYTTGYFRNIVDFDPGQGTYYLNSTNSNDDIFISKWTQCFIDTTITLYNDTLTANQQNASYQWLNCDSSYSNINGATSQSYTPSQNGNYTCEITLNGCVDTTACVQVILTGIEKNALSEEYKIYPNPFTDQITIESVGVDSNTKLEIINIKGQVIYKSTTLLNGNTVLNTADWAKGIYFVRLTNEQGVGTFKLAHQ